MDWLRNSAPLTDENVRLDKLTWYRLGGRARYLVRPRSVEELKGVVVEAGRHGVSARILGGGANVLVSDDGVDGIVVRLSEPAFKEIDVDSCRVSAGAGVDLMVLVRKMCERGLGGLEGLTGIPGTVGGALRMNAGGQHGSICDTVVEATVLKRDGSVERWSKEQIGFGYRSSGIGDSIVLSVAFNLSLGDSQKLRAAHKELMRQKLASQPMAEHSAGCVFKNPPNGLPAGALIEQAGMKGVRCGGAYVSQKHANFVLADKGATASDVSELIEKVRACVQDRMGVDLELEIETW